jgi:SH3-like domain-containing protein
LKDSSRPRDESGEIRIRLSLKKLIGAAVLMSILFEGLVGSAFGSQYVEGTGLPVPRFASVKSKPANVRAGPGVDYPLRWTFVRRHLPVEILAEFGNWRRIRDADGEEGWILSALLSGRRTALVAPWSAAKPVRLRNHSRPNSTVKAVVEPRVLVMVDRCAGIWCYVRAANFWGYVRQTRLWGVYPDEAF